MYASLSLLVSTMKGTRRSQEWENGKVVNLIDTDMESCWVQTVMHEALGFVEGTLRCSSIKV